MSNYELKSKIADLKSRNNSLEREIDQVEEDNRRLQGEINLMVTTVAQSYEAIDQECTQTVNTLVTGKTRVDTSNDILIKAYDLQKANEEEFHRYKIMENSYKNIRSLNEKLYSQYKEYFAVRNVARAMIENINAKMVGNEQIRAQMERLNMYTKDFYLSNALMSILLLESEEIDASNRAVETADKLDRTNLRIFMFLYYMALAKRNDDDSQKNYKEAYSWISKMKDRQGIDIISFFRSNERFMMLFFLVSEDPQMRTGYLPLDQILEQEWKQFAKEEADGAAQVTGKILDWYFRETVCRHYSAAAGKREIAPIDEVLKERKTIASIASDNGQNYKMLRQTVAEYPDMMLALGLASENENVYSLLMEVEGRQRKNYYGDFLSLITDDFIENATTPEIDEKYAQIAKEEAIIACRGDLGKANTYISHKRDADASSGLLDYMYKWINLPEDFAAKGRVVRAAFHKLRPCYRAAYDRFRDTYRSIMPKKYTVTIDDFSTKTDFRSFDADAAEVDKHFLKIAEEKRKALKKSRYIVPFVFAALFAVATVALSIAKVGPQNGMVLGIVCALGGVVSGIMGLKNLDRHKKVLAEIDTQMQMNRARVKAVLEQVYADYKERFSAKYQETEEMAQKVCDFLSGQEPVAQDAQLSE